MGDDRNERTSHRRRRRSGIDSVSGKCVVCASSIVAGIAGMGLSWLAGSEYPGTAAATRFGEIKLIDSSDPLASLENLVIVLPGADDTVVLPSDNVINLPFGGDGLNNFFGPGEAGAAGGTADIATGDTWSVFTTPVEQFTIPFLNDTIILPGSDDEIFSLSNLFSGNAINLPFFGDGENDFFGSVFPDIGSALSNAGVATGDTDTVSSIPTESLPTDAIVLPGSADTIVFPSFNTINLPFGGDGENNFFGGGDGGDGGDGHRHDSELSRWDQAYQGPPAADPADPAGALADLVVVAVRAAVLAPEAELRRWFTWSWYWADALIDDLVRAGRLRRLDAHVSIK